MERRNRYGEKTSEMLSKKEPTLGPGVSLPKSVTMSYTIMFHTIAMGPGPPRTSLFNPSSKFQNHRLLELEQFPASIYLHPHPPTPVSSLSHSRHPKVLPHTTPS